MAKADLEVDRLTGRSAARMIDALRGDAGRRDGGPVCVLLCLEHRLLRELTRKALSRIPGIRIVGDCREQARIQAVIDRERVHWVIINGPGAGSPLAEESRVLLSRNPTVSLLEIAMDGGSLKAWWFNLHEEIIRSPTLEDIVSVLQTGAGGKARPGKA